MRMGLLGNAAAGSCAKAGRARKNAARTAVTRISVELRAGGLHELRPAREVGLDLRAELLGRVRDRLDAVAVEPLQEIRPADDGDRIVVDLFHDLARRPRRR